MFSVKAVELNKGLLYGALALYLLIAILASNDLNIFKDADSMIGGTVIYMVITIIYMVMINLLFATSWLISDVLPLPFTDRQKCTAFNIFYWFSIFMPLLTMGVLYFMISQEH